MVDPLLKLASGARGYSESRSEAWVAQLKSRIVRAAEGKSFDMLYASLVMLSEYYANKSFSEFNDYATDKVEWSDFQLSFEFLRHAVSCLPKCRAELTYVSLSHVLSLALWGRIVEREDAYSVAIKSIPNDLSVFDKSTKNNGFSELKGLVYSEDLGCLTGNAYQLKLRTCIESGDVNDLLELHLVQCSFSNSSVPVLNLASSVIPLDVFWVKRLNPELVLGRFDEFFHSVKLNRNYAIHELVEYLDVELI